jgi:hypothetical protein
MSKIDPNNVMPRMCATCPWRKNSPVRHLRDYLQRSAITESNRICHSTGNNPTVKRVRVKERLCRGARNYQLAFFHRIGFLVEPTDEAWASKLEECKNLMP